MWNTYYVQLEVKRSERNYMYLAAMVATSIDHLALKISRIHDAEVGPLGLTVLYETMDKAEFDRRVRALDDKCGVPAV